MESLETDVLVIGAGVVGLAIAYEISKKYPRKNIIIIEKHFKYGQEGSSHNSEVIHAGIYYSNKTLKGRHCIRGRELLYEFCNNYDIPHKKCGKFLIATDLTQVPAIEKIRKIGRDNDVPIDFIDHKTIIEKQKNSKIVSALWSPTSGIVDSHELMKRLESLAISAGTIVSYGTNLEEVLEVTDSSIYVKIRDKNADSVIKTNLLINAAGLAATKIANLLLAEKYETKPCRGRYFSIPRTYSERFESLTYPIPDPKGGLGVHITMDLGGNCRLGPDVDWSFADKSEPDDLALYQFSNTDISEQIEFLKSGMRLIPDLQFHDLKPDYIGVRPKLFMNKEPLTDFIIARGKRDIHLLGIESPGLTAALSLAEEVGNIFPLFQ